MNGLDITDIIIMLNAFGDQHAHNYTGKIDGRLSQDSPGRKD